MEPQHRLMLLSGIIAAVCGLLAGFLGSRLAGPPLPEMSAVARSGRFQLVDRDGRERGRLEVDQHGVARLSLCGQDVALPLVSLAADPHLGARLELDDQRQGAVVLHAAPQGARSIALYQEGRLRLGLEVQKNGDAAVNFYDKGNRIITLGLNHQDDPHLVFYGAGQKPALDMVSKKNGDRNLQLFGKDGTPRLVLGLKHDNKAALGLFDRQGKTRAALLDEPALILLKRGKLVRTLP